jgi:Na+-translocating ferredoxin:NAD+ oxidoreductase RnfD subunit
LSESAIASAANIAQTQSSSAQLQRFFRTPKGLLIIALTLLLVVAALGTGIALVAPGVVGAAIVAMLVDAPILRYREGEWQFPSGALLTGMIVAMVLSPFQPWYVAPVTAAVAVLTKYIARTRSANIFNPAAIALVGAFAVFHSPQSWWGALPELPPLAIVVLFAIGIFISDRVNKMPSVVAFLGTYFLLFTLAAFFGDPAHVAGLFRAPDLHAALFFAFFMVTDPPTSPPKQRDQIVFGVMVAVVSFAIYEIWHWVAFLLIGLLLANVWEAWRRGYHKRSRARVKAST